MKRHVLALSLCLALCGCTAEVTATSPEPHIPQEKNFPTTNEANETSPADESGISPLSEQQRLERLILDVRGTAVIPAFNEEYCPPESYALFPMLFGDFDKDGTEELFAVYGVAGGYENAAAGEVWFARGDTAERLDTDEEIKLWEVGNFRVLDEENTLVAYSYLAMTYASDRIWRINGGAEKTEIDGFARMSFTKSEYGGFSAQNSTYDAVYGCGGHTWKDYWFYYDAQNNAMVQYDAHEISEEEMLEYSGGEEALSEIRADGLDEVHSILLFDNGIVCVNYIREKIYNFFRCFDAAGNELLDITPEFNEGIYLPRNGEIT